MTTTGIPIYSIAYPDQVPEGIFASLLGRVPMSIARKVSTFRRWEDRHASLFGKLLLMTALEDAGLPPDLGDLQYTPFGRPFLANSPDFNISHSGNRVACVLSRQGEVGIDLERIKELAIGDFRNQFTEREWAAINGAPDPLPVFYHYWTAKEAIIKADGRGLSMPLPLDQLRVEQDTVVDTGDRRWHICRISCFEGYACHIATEMPMAPPILKEMSLAELLERRREVR